MALRFFKLPKNGFSDRFTWKARASVVLVPSRVVDIGLDGLCSFTPWVQSFCLIGQRGRLCFGGGHVYA